MNNNCIRNTELHMWKYTSTRIQFFSTAKDGINTLQNDGWPYMCPWPAVVTMATE